MKTIFTITNPKVGRHRGFINNPAKRKEQADLRKKCIDDLVGFLKFCGFKVIAKDHNLILVTDKHKEKLPFSLGESFITISNKHYRSTMKMQLYYDKPLDVEKYKAKAIEIINDYIEHFTKEQKSESIRNVVLKIASGMVDELDKKKIETEFDVNDDNDLIFTHKITHKSGDTDWLFSLTFKLDGTIHFRISDDNDDFLRVMYKGVNITDYLNAEVYPAFFNDVDKSRNKLVGYMKVAEEIKSVYLKTAKLIRFDII